MRIRITVLLLLFGWMTACTNDQIIEVTPVPQSEPVSFKNDIIPLFESQCASCHYPGGDAPDLTLPAAYNEVMNGYVVVGKPDESILYTTVLDAGHTGNPMSADELALLWNWINQGAKNN